jgi:hypothetical protein
MNLSLINFNLLNENLTYQMREPFKRKGIRCLALNGGIRWVSLNEREKAVKEKGDMRGKKHLGEGDYFFGGSIIFQIGRLYYWFFWLEKLVVGLLQRGHLLLGVLGSGARNPYGILELGSQKGSVPSWLRG